MGNVLLDDYKKDDPLESFDKWLQENPELSGKQILAENKLFLTSSFMYSSKQIVLKVYFKRQNIPVNDYLNIYQQKCVNLIPLTILNIKDILEKKQNNLIMATRQYLHLTLEEKLQRRPTMSLQEKKWMIFQMMLAVDTVHYKLNLYHGNLRTSNFMVTSYEYMYLTDFANYKPTYILEDTEQGLTQFRLFYPSSQSKCNLAPEKLQGRSQSASKIKSSQYLFNLYKENKTDNRESSRYSLAGNRKNSSSEEKNKKIKTQLDSDSISYFAHVNNLKEMDLFSLGLCILEVLNDGKSSFTYENLLSLKKKNFNIKGMIDNICKQSQCGQDIHQIVEGLLIQRKNTEKPLSTRFQNLMNDQVFNLLWHCLSCFTKVSFQLSDHRVYLFHNIIEFIEKDIKGSPHTFTMKRAKCLQNYGTVKIMVELIKKKLILSTPFKSDSILGKIVNFIDKKDIDSGVIESKDEAEEAQNQRQSYFISSQNKKIIEKRHSFVKNAKQQKVLCPPKYDQLLSCLVEPSVSQNRFSKLSLEDRRKNKLQKYLIKIKNSQHVRQKIISRKNYFYSQYDLIIKLVFSCIRSCRYVASKMLAIELINIMANESKDCTLLKTIMPYYIALCQDTDISVAKYALNSLIDMFYFFVDPFETDEDIPYYQILLEFLLNIIKGSKIRIFMFARFKEIYFICEWLELACLKLSRDRQATKKFSFYKLVDHLKIYYGTLSAKEILSLMENIPIAILPEMFEFYISFLNTEKIMGLKCSLFIAENAVQQFETQRNILQIFDNCMESGLLETGIALYYSIKYFTIRKNTHLDIVQKIAPHVINPHVWIRDQVLKFIEMCLEQFPPTKIFFLFRDVFEPPFPLCPQDLEDEILLPQPLKDSEINVRQRKFSTSMTRKVGLTEKKFGDYLCLRKTQPKDNSSSNSKKSRSEDLEVWNNETKCFREQRDKVQGQNLNTCMKKAVEQLYQQFYSNQQLNRNNFFYYGIHLEKKFNITDRQKGLQRLFDILKKLSKFSFDTNFIAQEQKQFFDSLFANINSSFQNLLTKHSTAIVPEKLKLALCINVIAQQLYIFNQFQVKPSMNLGTVSQNALKNNQNNFRPKGVQICQIYENKDTISDLIKIGDYFFLSGCHDGTMRIYSTKSIEMNIVMQSQAVYEIRADNSEERVKINALACLDNTFTAVVGTNKGQIKGYQIERMPSKFDSSRLIKAQNQQQLFKFNAGGDIQKMTIPKMTYFNETVAYVTAESVLGIQDIRCRQNSMKCVLGKQRGFCLSLASNEQSSILIGTIDGYLLTYDIRFNVVSSVLQLNKDGQSLPITKIVNVPGQRCLCIAYPYSSFQFAQFNVNSSEMRIQPNRLYHGISGGHGFGSSNHSGGHHTSRQQDNNIPSIPYLQNKTNDEVFRLCNNNIQKHMYYRNLSNFDTNYKILDYVSQPLTLKQSKIRQVWANGCRHRYNQVLSIYNKKSVPFVEYMSGGILTNFNPVPVSSSSEHSSQFSRNGSSSTPKSFSYLVQRRQKQSTRDRDTQQIDRELITRTNKIKISTFDEQENKDFYTSCSIVNGYMAFAAKNNKIKIFK